MKAKQIYTFCIYSAFFVCAIVFTTQGAMLTSWIEHYRLESAAQGAIGAAQSAGMTAALFILLLQAGRIAKNTIVTFSFISLVVLLFAVSFMPPFVLLIVLYSLIGIFYGSVSSMMSSVMADIYYGKDSSKYMSRLHGIFGIGGLMLPFFFRGLLNGGMYWNIAFRIMVFIMAAILVMFILLSRYSLRTLELSKRSSQKITRADLQMFFKRGPNLLLILGILLYGSHQSVIMVWLIRYVEVVLEAPTISALAMSLYWVGVTLTRLFIFKILPTPPIKIVFIGNFVAAIMISAGVLSGSAVAVAIFTLIMGFANGTSIPVLISACCTDNDCNTMLPTNVINISLYTAFFLCPLLIGALESYSSLHEGMHLSSIFAALCGLTVLLYWRKTHK